MITRLLLGLVAAPVLVLAGLVAPTTTTATSTSSAPSSSASEDDEERPGGIGLRLTEAPESGRDDPRARVYIVDHLPPGTTIERGIEVSNTTSSSQNVVLYSGAASIDDGSFVGAAADTPNELSTWTSVTPTGLNIPADGAIAATVTIAVPSDAAPGEQYAVVWVEARSQADGGGVVQVSRVGIRLYVSVGPGGPPAADFEIESLIASRSPAGSPVISASVRNTGGRALDLNGTLELLDGPGGLSAGPFPADLTRTLAIGDTHDVSVTLDDALPAGPWLASVTLGSGLTTRTVEATVTFPETGAATAVDTRTEESSRGWLLPAAGGALALVVLAGLATLTWRRRDRRQRARRWAGPTGASERHHPPPIVA